MQNIEREGDGEKEGVGIAEKLLSAVLKIKSTKKTSENGEKGGTKNEKGNLCSPTKWFRCKIVYPCPFQKLHMMRGKYTHPSPPVPDVLPDASNCCTLLINLGLTIKKVC
jgi:hypothetical protein